MGGDWYCALQNGETAIMIASAFGHVNIVTVLMKAGAKIEASDKVIFLVMCECGCTTEWREKAEQMEEGLAIVVHKS